MGDTCPEAMKRRHASLHISCARGRPLKLALALALSCALSRTLVDVVCVRAHTCARAHGRVGAWVRGSLCALVRGHSKCVDARACLRTGMRAHGRTDTQVGGRVGVWAQNYESDFIKGAERCHYDCPPHI